MLIGHKMVLSELESCLLPTKTFPLSVSQQVALELTTALHLLTFHEEKVFGLYFFPLLKCKPISFFDYPSANGTVQRPVSTSDLRTHSHSLSLLLLFSFRFISTSDYCFPVVKEFCSVQTVSLRLLRYPAYRENKV